MSDQIIYIVLALLITGVVHIVISMISEVRKEERDEDGSV
jgi:hypothetical protein